MTVFRSGGPNTNPSYRATGGVTCHVRPFINLGEVIPAADPGYTIVNPTDGPVVMFGTVDPGNADHWITLPLPIPGTEVTLLNDGTGYELRTNAPTTVFINASSAGAAAESAIAASLTVWARCITPTYWVVNNFALNGTEAAEEAAA